MRETYQPSLSPDSGDGLFSRNSAGHFFGKEKSHYLPYRGKDLLGHNHLERGNFLKFDSTGNGTVVCYSDTIDPYLEATIDDSLQRRATIKRVLGVNVKVSP